MSLKVMVHGTDAVLGARAIYNDVQSVRTATSVSISGKSFGGGGGDSIAYYATM